MNFHIFIFLLVQDKNNFQEQTLMFHYINLSVCSLILFTFRIDSYHITCLFLEWMVVISSLKVKESHFRYFFSHQLEDNTDVHLNDIHESLSL